MGSDLPVLKPKEVVKILNKLGCVFVRQKGSHQQFRHADGRATTVPVPKEIYLLFYLGKSVKTSI
jgi:predicted RNA binding protein YcfA (HicA-like mRNA interferase family)